MSDSTAYRTGADSERRTEFFVDAIEQAVDESARLLGPELLGDLDRLVDRDLRRHLGRPQELVDRQPEDVAVDDGHPLEVPVLRELRDRVIDLRLVRLHAADERIAEGTRVVVDGMPRPELLVVRNRIVVAVEVELVQELEGDLAGLPALAHRAPGGRLIGVGHVPGARDSASRDDRRAGESTRPSAVPPRRPLRRDCPRPRPRGPTPAPRSAR